MTPFWSPYNLHEQRPLCDIFLETCGGPFVADVGTLAIFMSGGPLAAHFGALSIFMVGGPFVAISELSN